MAEELPAQDVANGPQAKFVLKLVNAFPSLFLRLTERGRARAASCCGRERVPEVGLKRLTCVSQAKGPEGYGVDAWPLGYLDRMRCLRTPGRRQESIRGSEDGEVVRHEVANERELK